MNFHAKRRNVLFLELSGQMSLHECGLAHATISNQNQFKLWNFLLRLERFAKCAN
jgi:hypothetical protein